MTKRDIENIAKEVIDCGFIIHKSIGPGLLESAYQKTLAYELSSILKFCFSMHLEEIWLPALNAYGTSALWFRKLHLMEIAATNRKKFAQLCNR